MHYATMQLKRGSLKSKLLRTVAEKIFTGSNAIQTTAQEYQCWKHYTTRKPSWRKGYARQRHHSKMAVSRHLGFYGTANSAIRSVDPENPNLELNMEWIRCTVCKIFAFKLYCDLETGVRGHSRSSKVALFGRAHTTLYSYSIVTNASIYYRCHI